jgi:hypothetical protein
MGRGILRQTLESPWSRTLRDYYAGKLGEQDLESRILRDVNEDRFRAICRTTLEGLATKKFNLEIRAGAP